MTGEDVSTRQKGLSVAFSVIMVLSMVAVGMAGFAGSAAALEQPAVDESASSQSTYGQDVSISASPADPGAPSTHTITVNLNGSQDSSNLDEVRVNYSQASSTFDIDNVATNDDVTVTSDGSGSLHSVNDVTNSSGQLVVSFDDSGDSSPLTDGDTLTITIGGTSQLTNAEAGDYDIGVQVSTENSNTESVDLPLQLPGPVQVYSDQHTTDGTPNGNYTLIGDALSSSDVDGDDLVDVAEGEYRERGSSVTVINSNVTIEGSNQPFINVSSGNAVDIQAGDVIINNFEVRGADNSDTIRQMSVSNADTFTNISDSLVHVRASSSQAVGLRSQGPVNVDNVEFAGQDKSNNGYGVWVTSDANNANIASSTFTNLSVGTQTTAQNGLQVSNNTFDEIGATAVIVASGNGDQDTDNVDVTGNSITNASYAFWVNDRDNSDNVVQVNITDNTVTGTGSETGALIQAGEVDLLSNELTDLQNATDVQAQNVNGELDIQSNTVHNASTGLYVAGDPATTDNLNVHFNEYTENTDGVVVNSDFGSESGDLLNVTFNDFVDTESNALNVTGSIDGQVNANYSWWDNRDSSRIVGPYTPQNAESQLLSPRRVYSYTRLHTGGQP